MIGSRTVRILYLFLAAVLAAGCSNEPSMGEVHGVVTVDGQPAATGAITFFPRDGGSAVTGGEITDGRYRIKVPPGAVRVEIRVSRKVGERKLYNTPNSPVQPTMEEVLPARYNTKSELTLDVANGVQEKNWDLKTK
jgi:hypothetical protein